MSDEAVKPKETPKAKAPRASQENEQTGGPFPTLMAFFAFIGEVVVLTGRTIAAIVSGGVNMGDLLTQMESIGVGSVNIVLVVTAATGAVFAYYTTSIAKEVGYTDFVGGTLAYGFLNELGPVLGGVAFAARVGAEVAAEIGTMVVTEQVSALQAMAVSPIRYLVAPRVLASVLMLPLLTVIADVAGLFGGYIFAGLNGVPHASFLNSMHQYAAPQDLIRGLIKALVFGFLVGIVSCYQGLQTTGGATGVGRSTTRSVVICVVLIFVFDFFLTQLLSQQLTRR